MSFTAVNKTLILGSSISGYFAFVHWTHIFFFLENCEHIFKICTKSNFLITNSFIYLQLWFRGIRPSKFRHVYGLPTRKELCYTDISVVRSGNDGNFCAVNPKFLAIVADIAFVVIPISQVNFQFFNQFLDF